jgi:hypothetical protein
LEHLHAPSCTKLGDVTSLTRCQALRFLDLERSSVTDASMLALASVATLEVLNLSSCAQIQDVSGLSGSVSLRELDLSHTPLQLHEMESGVRTSCVGGLWSGWTGVYPQRKELQSCTRFVHSSIRPSTR